MKPLPQSDNSALNVFRPACGQFHTLYSDAQEIYKSTTKRMSTDWQKNPGLYASGYTGCLRDVQVGLGNSAPEKGLDAATLTRMDPALNADTTVFEKHGEYAAAAALEDDAKKTLTHLSELTQPNPSNRAENQPVHEDIKNLYFAFPKQPFEETTDVREKYKLDGVTCYQLQFNKTFSRPQMVDYMAPSGGGNGYARVKAYAELQEDSKEFCHDGTQYSRDYQKRSFYDKIF